MSFRRNTKYIRFVRTLACVRCGEDRPGMVGPHHISGVGHFDGMALKAPDVFSMPMCDRCHRLMPPQGWDQALVDRQAEWVLRTQMMALEAGVEL